MIVLSLLLIKWILIIIGSGIVIAGTVFFIKSKEKPHNLNKRIGLVLIMIAGIFLVIISGRIEYEIPETSVRDAIEKFKLESGET